MNVYQKLSKARVMLQAKSLKKSGKNIFSRYGYFELQDFLPEVNLIFEQIGICSIISFTQEIATMTIFNSDEKQNDSIVITSPMAEAALKGCHAIQNLGAVQTYLRRYLYMIALEIVENDILDNSHDSNNVIENKPAKQENKPQPEQSMPDNWWALTDGQRIIKNKQNGTNFPVKKE